MGGTAVTTRMGPPPGPHRAARWPCTPRHPSPPQAVGGHTGDVPYWGLKVQSHDVAGKDDFGLRFGCSLVWCTALGFRLEAVEVVDEIQIQSLRWGGVLLPRSVTRGGSLLLLPAPSCCLLREEQLCHLTGTAPRPAPAHVAWGRVTFASCDSRTSPSRLRSASAPRFLSGETWSFIAHFGIAHEEWEQQDGCFGAARVPRRRAGVVLRSVWGWR